MNTNKPIPNPPSKMQGLRELYQKAASTSFLMSEDEISQMLSPEQLKNIREEQRLRLSQQSKPEDGKIIQEAPLDAQPQGHYWDELRKLKRVKIITDSKFSGVIFSKRQKEEEPS